MRQGGRTGDGYYDTFAHTADLGVTFQAATREELFCLAPRVVAHLLTGRWAIDSRKQVAVALESPGPEELMVDFLREVLYLFTKDKFLVTDCRLIRLEETKLEATLAGDTWEPGDPGTLREIKAVTYHLLEVAKSGPGWRARVVFDV